ncbi:toll-like receptor 2 [Pseudophryne corroboree]|uniref:toll-like receptor 2 n=1 Tax=Pseudophryne corroboree TaxID=495146 RepID=UPI003081F826
MFQNSMRLMAFLLLLAALGSWHCVISCNISPDGNFAYCKGNNLNDVPQNLSYNLEYLDLSYNTISEITTNSFSQYPYLQTLNLSFNNISSVEDASFQNNLGMRNLSLFNNSLVEIPSALTQLENLNVLDLSNNLYPYATLGDMFYKLGNLQDLSIGGPLVSKVLKYDFVPIQNISLQKFALKTKSSLGYYEPGAFSLLNTQVLWLDIAIDNNATLLRDMLADLSGKTFNSLRFRNLFEFSYYEGAVDIFSSIPYINLEELVFYRGKFNEYLLRLVLQNVQLSNLQNLSLLSVDFARSLNGDKTNVTINNLVLNQLLIKDVTNPDILRFDWTFIWFSKVTNLYIINVNFNFVPCDAWGQMTNVVTLNISANRLLASYLFNLLCKYSVLPVIETFNVSNNQVHSLRTISLLTATWPKLTNLDLSNNYIGTLNESCVWTPSIKVLSLSYNLLSEDIFKCLPLTLEYLDMSNSLLDRLNMSYFKHAANLTSLILSNNKIKFIAKSWNSANLQVLALEGNSFGTIDQGSFQHLPQLKELTAGNNPYHCTCDLSAFIKGTITSGSLIVPDWPDNYFCYHPLSLLDTRLDLYSPGKLECNVSLVVAISVSVTAFVVIVCMLLCWRFNVPWYLRATCQIIRSKYRARKFQEAKNYAYHAFISYSYSDADWVRCVLLPRLESCNPPYRICIHERDFLPGKWIIDNIIDNIENSCKIIFILSRNFINSEWCNYELYFAHQRAIGHAFEDVILVVKENVSMKDLPRKFCRLRKMLRTKTYLEWPMEESRQPFFWVQLTSILGRGGQGAPGQENFSLVKETANVDSNSENNSVNTLPADQNLDIVSPSFFV